jgi:hypothetical protein
MTRSIGSGSTTSSGGGDTGPTVSRVGQSEFGLTIDSTDGLPNWLLWGPGSGHQINGAQDPGVKKEIRYTNGGIADFSGDADDTWPTGETLTIGCIYNLDAFDYTKITEVRQQSTVTLYSTQPEASYLDSFTSLFTFTNGTDANILVEGSKDISVDSPASDGIIYIGYELSRDGIDVLYSTNHYPGDDVPVVGTYTGFSVPDETVIPVVQMRVSNEEGWTLQTRNPRMIVQ